MIESALILLMNSLWLFLRIAPGGSFPRPLSREEEQTYLERWAQGDTDARNKLIEHNLRLVSHIMKKYYAQSDDMDDLLSIGTIGLIKGIDSYRPDRGVKLSTYCSRCVENEVLMYFRSRRRSQGDLSLSEALESDEDGSLSILDVLADEEEPGDLVLYGMAADSYNFDRASRGWINNFDFTLSGNANDRVYWGFTVSFADVNYKGYSEYAESMRFSSGAPGGKVSYGDMRTIKGSGVDVKAGIIVRPVEYSPFRVGLYVNTPTWYDLKTDNITALVNESALGENLDGTYTDLGDIDNRYEFRYYTPWKFGVSLGHTIGTNLAIGATYEFSDYGASQNRVKDGYDAYGNEDSYKDTQMKQNTEDVMKGVSTLKVGVEFKPIPELALRAGYNYISPAYNKSGMRDMTLDSYGVMYASTSDYVNWDSTNRFTCGAGCKIGKMNLDVAYQYSTTDGTFYPFQPNIMSNSSIPGSVTPASVSNKRHQVLLTLGYTF